MKSGALTLDEFSRLERAAAGNDRWNVAYHAEMLAANTGMRGGEIRKLCLGAVDLDNRRIRITRKSAKTNAGARLVELNSAALAAVSKLYQRAELLGCTAFLGAWNINVGTSAGFFQQRVIT